MNKFLLGIILTVFFAACSSLPSGNGDATPLVMTAEMTTAIPDAVTQTISTPEPLPVVPTELKYRILDEFPDFFFCDPDFYPVARDDELILAQQRFPDLQANETEFQAILSHNGLRGTTSFTDDQKLLIYREHKKMNAIYFETSGEVYRFQIQTGQEGQQGTVITGTIDASGSIDIVQRESGFPACPICLAAGTLIDTPRGAVGVENLQVGDPVWTMNEAGERVPALILQTGSVRVPTHHRMIHVTLNDGREVWASPGHPTADGRSFSDLKVDDPLDGVHVTRLEQVIYTGTFTFDILPTGSTGFYWANGILVSSTLKK